jgi:hypothetical protein
MNAIPAELPAGNDVVSGEKQPKLGLPECQTALDSQAHARTGLQMSQKSICKARKAIFFVPAAQSC